MSKHADWETTLIKNKQGAYLPCLSNITAILAHSKEWHNVLAFDGFAGVVVKRKQPPWPEDICPEDDSLGDWTRDDSSRTVVSLTREWNFAATTSLVDEAVQIVANRWVFHPVRDWFNELPQWDRKPRLDTHLIRIAGAPDNLYVRAITKNFFIGACARIWMPGCKVDTMLVLEGPQGGGKSTWFRIMAGDDWFLETSIDIGTKDGYQALRRKWIAELGELDALNRAEVSRVKQFLTATKDTYRPSYGRQPIDFLRQSVFGGSTNPDGAGYMKDVTGGRRFNPVTVVKVDLKAARHERIQIWAETLYRYRRNESWHIQDPKTLKAAAEEVEERRQADPWEDHVRDWLLGNRGFVKNGATTKCILTEAIGMPVDRQGRADQIRVGQALRAVGWDVVRQDSYGTRWYSPADPSKWFNHNPTNKK